MSAPSNDADPIRPGAILAGKYRAERVIGSGESTVVVEATQTSVQERVALKVLLPAHAADAGAVQGFLREAKATVMLKNEHAVRVSDAGTLEDGAPYIAMELLDGLDLGSIVDRRGVCPIGDALEYILQAAEVIAEAHALGIVHRGLRPAKMFLGRKPDGSPLVKVLDFGACKLAGASDELSGADLVTPGSAAYVAPEQMQEPPTGDHRADIYALGISLYELLAGRPPFQADTLTQLCNEVLTGAPTPLRVLRADVPEGLVAVLEKAYARDPEQRHPSVAALAAGLAPFAPPRAQASLNVIAHSAGLPPALAGGGPGHVQHMAVEIPISGYHGPVSRRAAAAFAANAAAPPPTLPPPPEISSSPTLKLAVIAALAILMGLAIGAGAYLFLRGRAGPVFAPPRDPNGQIGATTSEPRAPIADPTASGAPAPGSAELPATTPE